MDSIAMAKGLFDAGDLYGVISFYYGQRHAKELEFARQFAEDLNISWWKIEVPHFGESVKSALTSDVDVPEGHYTEESMKVTVVPNRNMVMLSMAAGVAISNNFEAIATAVHAGDHAIYPDCRPRFISNLEHTIRIANEGFIYPQFRVLAPFISMTKAEIVAFGDRHRVPWKNTWSCYNGGEDHCGRCATCIERMEAFQVALVSDPTHYETWTKYNELRAVGKVGQPQPFGRL